MAYTCELVPGQSIYLDNAGEHTTVTVVASSAGQQQQSSSQFATGAWTAPPEMFCTAQGIIIKLTTTQGAQHLQVQGTQSGWMTNTPPLSNAQQVQMSTVSSMPQTMPSMQPMQPMQPIQPMQPMQPMKMGDMEMSTSPMQMRMGNMAMQMGGPNPGGESNAAAKPKFCSQCGTPVKASDRFCAHCGYQLTA